MFFGLQVSLSFGHFGNAENAVTAAPSSLKTEKWQQKSGKTT